MSSSDAADPETGEEEVVVETDEQREAFVAAFSDALDGGVVDSHIRPGDDVWIRVSRESWQLTGRILRDRFGCRHFCFLSAIDWMPSPYGRYHEAEVDRAREIADGTAEPTEPEPIEQGYAGGETRFQVFARVTNITDHWGVTIKVDVPDDDLRVDTWCGNFAGANWHERECHEMFGIGFEGHPFLQNLYLPNGFEGHPLRKDFPLLARAVKPWPGIVDVEEMPAVDEPAVEAGDGDANEDTDR